MTNFSYLSAMQIFNIVIPLVTYSYLIRVLGSENYGLVVFAQAIVSYLMVLVSFGFSFSATQKISIHRNDREKISEIVSSVLIIKMSLLFAAFLILIALLIIIPEADDMELIFILSMWVCFYEALMPTWYFQGIEKMKYIVYFNFLSRTVFTSLIFIFVRASSDYLLLPTINGLGSLIACFGALYIVFARHKVPFKKQKLIVLKKYLQDSFAIFLSNSVVKIYDGTSKVLIGIYFGMTQVAFYDLAEKLSNLLKTPIQIAGQALFPKVASEKSSYYLTKTFWFVLLVSVFLAIISVIISDSIIKIVGGNEMLPAVPIFVILIVSIVPVTFSLFFANLTLLPFGYSREFLFSRLISMLFYALMISLLLAFNFLSPYKISVITVLTECFVAVFAIIFCNIKEVNFLKHKF